MDQQSNSIDASASEVRLGACRSRVEGTTRVWRLPLFFFGGSSRFAADTERPPSRGRAA
uniref:Uncharacterized protein n=1 Tax=Arundo donax TaxID=35708 RepID=A0A0A9HA18_ARUDO